MLLKYKAPPHHTLEAYGKVVYGGRTAEFTDEQAEELLTQPGVDVEQVEEDEVEETLVDEEPIEGYSQLNAEDARDELVDAIEDENEPLIKHIVSYEQAHANRSTVLSVAPNDETPEADGGGQTEQEGDN